MKKLLLAVTLCLLVLTLRAQIIVSASVYHPIKSETKTINWITADGSIIDTLDPFRHRWIGLSRNLISYWGGPFKYGDKVLIEGISPQLDGVYTVRDCMSGTLLPSGKLRFYNCVDILIGVKNKGLYGHWINVKLTRVK